MSDLVTSPAPAITHEGVRALLAQCWGVGDAALADLPSERDRNVRVGDRYVLKISNPAEPPDVIDMEVGALAHVRRADPALGVPRTVPSRSGRLVEDMTDELGRSCRVRLITRLDGHALEGRPIDRSLARQVGAISARTSLALSGYFHAAGGREIFWDIRRLPGLVPSDDTLARRLAPALDATRLLPSWLQHADVTLTNVLARGDGAGSVVGVLDFGDMHHTAAVCDLAATLTSVLRNTAPEQPATTWQLADAVLEGYQRHRLLSPAEVDVLGELVLARLGLTLAVSALRADRHAGNAAYITQYDGSTRRVLDELAALEPSALAGRFARLTGTARPPARDLGERRAAAMGGPLAPLFYRRPLSIVRGEAQWLIARDGTRYLDAYNNVAVVGHCHPAVTQAVSRQLAELNTHSRYLHAGVVELAERLLATMPPELDTCLFTTSGTEANELAWRLATEYTAGTGAIVAEHAYHGASKWMADLSSNEWPPDYRPPQVATFEAPRGPADGLDEATAAQRIGVAVDASRGGRPALVLADPQFTSEGILDAPAPYLRGLVAGTHAAGALFLADEVQSGFGRSGPQLWRFALAGITPDIVTLGKPMGAGYPVGAVITRREIADRLAQRYEYFSTFAATPAAAAAALAVLDVLEQNGLPEQAVRVGTYLRARLTELAAGHDALGEARGVGLIAGVDLIGTDAHDVLNGLVEQHVLAGLTGPDGTVLKIRPPLIWTEADVDLLVERLAAVLG